MEHELEPLVSGGHFYECPRWHEGHWWFSDFYSHTVSRIGDDGAAEVVLEVPGQPSGLGWLPGGDLLVASMKDHLVLRRADDGSVSTYADLTELTAGHVNDMLVSGDHAYVGCFGFDLMAGADPVPTNLAHIGPDGSATVAASDLWFPNGMVLSGGELVVAETLGGRFTAFRIGPDGSLGERRVWGQVAAVTPADLATMVATASFAPDGCALDAAGHIWAANAVGGAVCRVAPGGDIVEEIRMPEGLGVFACGLGGPDGRTLLTCAAPDFHEPARVAAREAVLLETTVEIPAPGSQNVNVR
jgi:sugar lactone lactonase YvrE